VLLYKVLIGLHARTLLTQKTGAKIACKIINIMTGLGMPVFRRIAWPAWERVKSVPFLIFAPTSFSVRSNRVGIRHIVRYTVIMHHMLMTGETFR
jgi:hypothetical protein